MNDERRATLIRTGIMVLVFGIAILAAFLIKIPPGALAWLARDEKALVPVAREDFKKEVARDDRLTVMNLSVTENRNSQRNAKVLIRVKERSNYGKRVVFTEFQIRPPGELSKEREEQYAQFAGGVDFYFDGKKLGSLTGVSNDAGIDEAIETHLKALAKLKGPDWLPELNELRNAAAERTPEVEWPAATPEPATR